MTPTKHDPYQELVDRVSDGLTVAEVANCFHQAFKGTSNQILNELGPDGTCDAYYALMFRVYRRINHRGCDYIKWLRENNYVLTGTEGYLDEKERRINERIAEQQSNKFAAANC